MVKRPNYQSRKTEIGCYCITPLGPVMKISMLLVVGFAWCFIAANAAVVAAQGYPGMPAGPADWRPQQVVAVGALTRALRDPSPTVRQSAAVALGKFGAEARTAIPALAALLRDPDGYVRIDAAHTLEKFRGFAVPAVTALLRDYDFQTRLLAVHTLEVIGPDAKLAVPALIERLSDPYPAVREATPFALRAIGTDAKTAGPLLANTLRDPDRIVRIAATKLLQHLGPDVIPYVAAMTADTDPTVRDLAITTMREIAEQSSVPPPPPAPQGF
jgi:HEAT repeat protein